MQDTSPLITPRDLLQDMQRPGLVILDARASLADPLFGRKAFARSHIAGARFADTETDVCGKKTGRNGRHPLPARDDFSAAMRRLGLSRSDRAVVYDDGSCSFAARLWFTLLWAGFSRVRVLSGGFRAWEAAGLPAESGDSPCEAGDFECAAPLVRVFTAGEVEANLKDPAFVLLDARAHDRFLGRNETIDPKAGHIPGALNRPSTGNIGADGFMKPAPELAREFREALGGCALPVVNYCGSGVTACANTLAMTEAGMPPAGVYIGSWSEWISDPARPVAASENE